MASADIITQVLSNGVTVLVEPMLHVQSAAITILHPTGSIYDAPGRSGTAAVLAELLPRGAGSRSARDLSAALDRLGVQRSTAVGPQHITISAATTAECLPRAIELLASAVTSPHLNPDDFHSARDLVRQTLHATEDELQRSLGDWQGGPGGRPETRPCQDAPRHIEHQSAQTHIGLSWPAVPYSHERYYEAWVAVSVLSGGMSSRLFTRVRERRGLCYAVSASLHSLRDRACVLGYAGTTNERAQQTLEAVVHEIRGLPEGLTEAELQRCRAQAKSALIMQQESTSSRAASLARDQWHLGRVRSLEEVRNIIDGITADDVRRYALDHAPRELVLVTIGPDPLNTDCLADAAAAV